MQALIQISDKQFLVEKGDTLFVPHQKAEVGNVIEVKPLARIEEDKTSLNSSDDIQLKVLEHLKDDKIIVFKKKRRKRYQKRNGHRQLMTRVEVL